MCGARGTRVFRWPGSIGAGLGPISPSPWRSGGFAPFAARETETAGNVPCRRRARGAMQNPLAQAPKRQPAPAGRGQAIGFESCAPWGTAARQLALDHLEPEGKTGSRRARSLYPLNGDAKRALDLDRQLKALGWDLVALQVIGDPLVDVDTAAALVVPGVRAARAHRDPGPEQLTRGPVPPHHRQQRPRTPDGRLHPRTGAGDVDDYSTGKGGRGKKDSVNPEGPSQFSRRLLQHARIVLQWAPENSRPG